MAARGATLVAVSDSRMDAGVREVVTRPSRLRALAALETNAQTAADALDRIAGTACRVLGVPVALVNLVGADRQRFVGCGGPEPWASMTDMPIDAGFCPFALGAEQAYTFADASLDADLAANPAVVQLGVTAYAGVPLRASDGEPIGTLCAVDYEAREWSEDDVTLLTELAASVMAELRLLTASSAVARNQSRLRRLTELSSALVPAETASDVIDEVLRAVDRFDANAVWVSVIDEAEQALRTEAASGTDVARHADVPLAATLPPAQVARTGEPDFLPTRDDVRDRFGGILEAAPDAGSIAVVPLTTGEQHLGVLGLCFAHERAFTADDREYLAALGGVSGLALARSPH
jgi:GAF domain-containing protein